MIKGILFDWHGVLVEEKNVDNNRRNELYNKLIENTATEDEIIEVATSFKKFEPLWEVLPELKKHFKMCVVNNGPKATFSHWDKYYGYSEFMDFVNSEMEGVKKPQPEIYLIACERLGVKPNEVIYMDDNCGFPEETENLGMNFIHWKTTDDGFKAFKQYLNDNTEVKIQINILEKEGKSMENKNGDKYDIIEKMITLLKNSNYSPRQSIEYIKFIDIETGNELEFGGCKQGREYFNIGAMGGILKRHANKNTIYINRNLNRKYIIELRELSESEEREIREKLES